MKARNRIALVLSSTALAVGAGAGVAIGAGSGSGGGPHGGGTPPGAAAIATYLGLTQAQIQSDLKSGQTFAQIAVAQGKTASGLEAAIVADAKTQLDAEVAAGTLTAAEETTMLAGLTSHVDDMVNSTGPPPGAGGPGGPGGHGGHGGPGGGPATAAIATYLGLTQAQIQADLKGGQTFAQIAVAQGKTASGLEAAIVADAKTHLDAAVTAGKLTSAQETTMLADLTSHVADMVNSSGPPKGGPGAPGAAGSSTATTNGKRLNGHLLHARIAR
jgi:hypothetical protein